MSGTYPDPIFSGLSIQSPLPIASGGTGGGTQSAALTALGAAAVAGSGAQVFSVAAPTATAHALSAVSSAVSIATVAAIRTNTVAWPSLYLRGYTTLGDGGEGVFQLVSTDTTSSDNGGTIIVDAAGHRYHRQGVTLAVSVLQFGAKGNGTTNDTAAFNAATAWMHAQGGGAVLVPVVPFLIDPIVIPANVTLQGVVQGPFEGNANPATTVIAPTLLVNSTATAFISLSGLSSSVSDILVFYPQQVQPTASTPNVYPATISVPANQGAANNIRRCTLVNSYIGISISNGRVIISECKIGAFSIGILIDPAEDFIMIDTVMIEPFWNTFLNLAFPQTIDTWVMNNSIGIQTGRVDGMTGSNISMFARFTGMNHVDGTQGGISPQYGFGRFSNVDLDTVAYGVVCKSSNFFAGGYQYTNLSVGANSGVGTPGAAWLALTTGGSGNPRVSINGGQIDGTWSVGGPGWNIQTTTNQQAYITNLLGDNPVGDIGPPTAPSTGVVFYNPYPIRCAVYVTGGTVTASSINGTAVGARTFFGLGVGDNIALTYTGTLTWVWIGD